MIDSILICVYLAFVFGIIVLVGFAVVEKSRIARAEAGHDYKEIEFVVEIVLLFVLILTRFRITVIWKCLHESC